MKFRYAKTAIFLFMASCSAPASQAIRDITAIQDITAKQLSFGYKMSREEVYVVRTLAGYYSERASFDKRCNIFSSYQWGDSPESERVTFSIIDQNKDMYLSPSEVHQIDKFLQRACENYQKEKSEKIPEGKEL